MDERNKEKRKETFSFRLHCHLFQRAHVDIFKLNKIMCKHFAKSRFETFYKETWPDYSKYSWEMEESIPDQESTYSLYTNFGLPDL